MKAYRFFKEAHLLPDCVTHCDVHVWSRNRNPYREDIDYVDVPQELEETLIKSHCVFVDMRGEIVDTSQLVR